ncbi:MAG: hypothetical protein ACRD88_15300, partial [Terriglobia bacterium]
MAVLLCAVGSLPWFEPRDFFWPDGAGFSVGYHSAHRSKHPTLRGAIMVYLTEILELPVYDA